MSASPTASATPATRPQSATAVTWAGRVVGAALLVWMGFDHFYLRQHYGYSHVPKLKWLFVVNGVGGIVAALAVLGSPRRFLPLVSAGGALLMLGTLLGLVLAINVSGGIWGITESSHAPLAHQVIVVEIVGTLVLAALAAGSFVNRSRA